MTDSPDVAIIGAGLIGITAGLALRARGLSVRVIDRGTPAPGTSVGNAGAFAFADLEPLATPGILRKAPRWLLDPLGPLALRPAYALRIAPWLLRFWRASWRDRYAAAVRAQAALMGLSSAALERLVAAEQASHLLRREGQLQLYDSEASFRASQRGWDLRRAHGIRFSLLDGAGAIAEIQPGLNPRFAHAGFTPDWINVTEPAAWLAHLAAAFRARGGEIVAGTVTALEPGEDGVRLMASPAPILARHVVIAAGAWSHRLTATLGEGLPLETERGYNTTLPRPGFDLRTQLTFADHGFVVTHAGGGIRVGGAVELGGLDAPPNYRRARVLLDKAMGFMPGLSDEGGQAWMGFRPSLPDSLPVIGRSARSPRVILAFGHGHLGLTQSAGTAELVADLVSNTPPAIDLAPYRPDRFRLFAPRP
jgi:D-amino-acid dehydrogenase